ncbi:MAG: response regulator transcription factor [Planctomycetota bacterium]|mgnify:CR=1 FL=1
MPKVLIVEDEPDMVRGLTDNLRMEGYEVHSVSDGAKAVDSVVKLKPDLILLDVMLPNRDGMEVCRDVRSRGLTTPIVMITAKGQEVDRVLGLELGADDYVTKPFSLRELLARIKAILRRTRVIPKAVAEIRVGDWVVDPRRYEAASGRKRVGLSHYEVQVLRMLVERKDEVVSRNEILNEVWGIDAFPTDRTVDNYIVKLRQKLEKDPRRPRHILTVHGAGYKFVGA